ncbi:glycosyltransferase family A protein [Microbacterium sp. ET2]|uniref:glycosyltransferase n=1 Tax=Microbacterium albipurpureum TaxID=3050384 RepID=UPI00259C9B3E|nr:glycosyltransferase family A protein [Microbacterium sp. ET2 (Ac-2212)]WJL94752.1 glycosyltransferase family A protein [Microbacterium sp. ET2 (Ac-2212)]
MEPLLAIVSPMHNEAHNITGLVASLNQQTFRNFHWFVVDDGSDDGTAEHLNQAASSIAPQIIRKKNDGGLIGGSAFSSWRRGVDRALESEAQFTHFMKLDADVRLEPEYLSRVLQLFSDTRVGLASGVITTRGMAEQAVHTPGPVKMYSREALDVVLTLPQAIGFDIMDEVLLESRGFETVVDKSVGFDLSRAIGASEGLVHGRVRNGRGCRWTGYSLPYFLVRCARYFLRRPFIVGPFAMLWGYLTAGPGPYSKDLRRRHARLQRTKLRRALAHPMRFYREVYAR